MRPYTVGACTGALRTSMTRFTPLSPLSAMRERGDPAHSDGWVRVYPGSPEARDVDSLLRDEFEQCRCSLAGLRDAAADRRHDLLGLGDPLAIAAQRLGEVGVMAADVGRAV